MEGKVKYLDRFTLPRDDVEGKYLTSFPYKLEMQCYSHTNVYPFRIFPQKRLENLNFEPITLFYGGNGSGKSTLLNVIAQKLKLERSAPFNNTPFIEEYLNFCDYELSFGNSAPRGSKIICSEDVFDVLLDVRSINEGIDRRRESLFEEYDKSREESYLLRDLDDLEEFKRRNETKRRTKSEYTTRRLPKEIDGKSNGESAFLYFTKQIKSDALYLLDEPENSLSARLQGELARFIEDSARFYNCQFIISTHSPFLLSMKGAKIYDLDSVPAESKNWTELENVRIYHDFFETHRDEFKNK
jgi:predicted ATPase